METSSGVRRLFHRPTSSQKWAIYLTLGMVLAIFTGFGIVEVYRVKGLFSYDPYYHMHLSEISENQQGIATRINYFDRTGAPSYITSMRLITSLIHEYTGISYLSIYRLFGILTRILTALALFIAVSYLLDDEKYGLIATIMFLSSPYIFLRSLITFPENLALPFHILIFYSILRILRKGKPDLALPLYASAASYIHYRSLIIPFLLLTIFTLLVILDRRVKKRFLYIFSLIVATAVLSAPILNMIYKQFRSYLKVNVGSGATWKPFTINNPAYDVPLLNQYLGHLGVPIVFFSIIGIAVLMRNFGKEKLILLLWTIFTFMLSRGKQIGIYVPTDRMFSFLCVPSSIVATMAIKNVLESLKHMPLARIAISSIITVLMIFSLMVTLPSVRGWVGITEAHIEAANWINENLDEKSVVISYKIDLFTMGVKRYPNISFLSDAEWKEIFNSSGSIKDHIINRFPGHDVYIMSTDDKFKLKSAEVVFFNDKIIIYRYKAG